MKNWIERNHLIIIILLTIFGLILPAIQLCSYLTLSKPVIQCLFDAPLGSNPVIVILNDGENKVKDLSYDHKIYNYDKRLRKITWYSDWGYKMSDHIYIGDLKPNAYRNFETIGITENEFKNTSKLFNIIVIYLIDLIFYREKDHKRYVKRFLFFVDDSGVHNKKEFQNKITLPRPLYVGFESGVADFPKSIGRSNFNLIISEIAKYEKEQPKKEGKETRRLEEVFRFIRRKSR